MAPMFMSYYFNALCNKIVKLGTKHANLIRGCTSFRAEGAHVYRYRAIESFESRAAGL